MRSLVPLGQSRGSRRQANPFCSEHRAQPCNPPADVQVTIGELDSEEATTSTPDRARVTQEAKRQSGLWDHVYNPSYSGG